MRTEPSAHLAPKDVLASIQHFLARVDTFFSRRDITYNASCQVTAATSVDDEIWTGSAQPNATMFVGSAVKSFILAEYLQQFGVPRHQLSVIDDNIRSISGSVFGFEGSDPEVNLEGTTLTRNVLEAMISHSDNTATDSILADVGADKVRDLIADVGLSSVKIPDSTRRLFAYLASGRNVDVDWETLKEYVNNPPNPQNAINEKQSMLASAADMVRWYQTALLKPGFFELPEELTEFKRISAMADALPRIVPTNLASYGKGGSITWNNFSCISASGQMIMPTHDAEQPWVPLTFSFTLNWGKDNPNLFGRVAQLFQLTTKDVLQTSLDSFYWTVTNLTLTIGNDDLAGTSGHDDFAGPGGGTDTLYGLGLDDAFHIRARQSGLIDGGTGYDTVYAIDAALDGGLAFHAVERLDAAEASLSATVDQLQRFSSIVPGSGSPDFDLVLRGAGGGLDLSSHFDSPVHLHVDATLTEARVVLTGTQNDDELAGSSFNDALVGGFGNDSIAGGAGNDVIAGGAGDDVLDGGTGFNAVTFASATRSVGVALVPGTAAGEGRDTLANFQKVIGSAYDDRLVGNAGANILFGADGNDRLVGLGGDDRLVGDAGADQLTGGMGSDRLVGGAGPDLFVFNRLAESNLVTGSDHVTDFNEADGDKIDLRAIDAQAAAAGDQPFTFIGSNPFSHTAGELRYVASGATGSLFGDVNGDAVADFAVRIDDHPTLTAGNILL